VWSATCNLCYKSHPPHAAFLFFSFLFFFLLLDATLSSVVFVVLEFYTTHSKQDCVYNTLQLMLLPTHLNVTDVEGMIRLCKGLSSQHQIWCSYWQSIENILFLHNMIGRDATIYVSSLGNRTTWRRRLLSELRVAVLLVGLPVRFLPPIPLAHQASPSSWPPRLCLNPCRPEGAPSWDLFQSMNWSQFYPMALEIMYVGSS